MWKKPFTGGHTVLRGHLTTNQYIFSVGIEVLNISHLTIFSKKENYFFKIAVKNYFCGAWPFLRQRGDGHIPFSLANYVPKIQFLSVFFKKPHTIWLKPKKLVLGAHFPHICDSIGPIVSKNNSVHPWLDPHQPCEFHENRFKTATCIVRSYIYI